MVEGGQRPEDAYNVSSPPVPNSSGELKICILMDALVVVGALIKQNYPSIIIKYLTCIT